jgi:hypothetical protein
VAGLHDLADFFGAGGVDDHEGFLAGFGVVGGPFGTGVADQVVFSGGDIVTADDEGEFCPGGAEGGVTDVMFRGLGENEGRGGGCGEFFRSDGAEVVGDAGASEEDWTGVNSRV